MTAARPLEPEPAVPPAIRLSLGAKILYGIGGAANAVKTVAFGLFSLYFYTSVMGLPGTLVGIASAIGLVWDAVIDPYIGYLSDRSDSPLGRRHSFMFAGALTMGLGLWCFFSPPRGLSNGALFAWLVGANLLVRTATSVYAIPYLALGAEASQDYHERTLITGIRGFIALAVTLGAAVFSLIVFFPDRVAGVDPKLSYQGYPAMGAALGLLMTVVALASAAGTLRWRAVTPGRLPGNRTRPSLLLDVLQPMRNPSLRLVFVSFALFFMSAAMNNVLAIYFYTHYVGITSSADISNFQIAFYSGGILGVLFLSRVARSVEKHVLYLLGALLTACVMFAALLFLGPERLYGRASVIPLVMGQALAGAFGSVVWFLPASMIADVVDEHELVSGSRREGSFLGVLNLGEQLAVGAAVLLAGALLDCFAKLVPNQMTQSPETIRRIGLLYAAIPAVLLVAAAALMLSYTLGRRRVAQIQAELSERGPSE